MNGFEENPNYKVYLNHLESGLLENCRGEYALYKEKKLIQVIPKSELVDLVEDLRKSEINGEILLQEIGGDTSFVGNKDKIVSAISKLEEIAKITN